MSVHRRFPLARAVVWVVLAALASSTLVGGTTDAAPRRRPGKQKHPPPPPEPPPAPEPTPPPAPVQSPGPLVAPAKANGKKARVVGILDVRLDGIPDDVAADFEKNLESSLDTDAYWLAGRDKMKDRLKFSTRWTEGCIIGDCLHEVKTQTNAELALLVALSGSGTSYGYVITVVRTDNGRVVAQESNRCDVCVVREVMRDVTLATIDLLNKVPDTLPNEAADRSAAIDLAVGKLVHHMHKSEATAKHKAIAVTLVGLVAAAAGAGIYFGADKPDYALAILGAGGGMALGGLAVLSF